MLLTVARGRARQLGREADLREADALELPFPDARFDTVVSTFVLCAVPDEHFQRRPLGRVKAEGLQIEERQRFKLGLIERLATRKPGPG